MRENQKVTPALTFDFHQSSPITLAMLLINHDIRAIEEKIEPLLEKRGAEAPL